MEQRRRRRGAVSIGSLVGSSLAPACRRRGFATASLMLHWPEIVGEHTARRAQPDRIVWPRGRGAEAQQAGLATVVVRADPMVALLLQHEAPMLIERINHTLGWQAVGRLKMTQQRAPIAQPPETTGPPWSADEGDVDQARAVVATRASDSPALAKALIRLGASVRARRRAGC